MPGAENATLWQVLFSPPVLITFIICALLGAIALWLALRWQRRSGVQTLAQQRTHQEATIERLLDSVAKDKDQLIADYEQRLGERDERIVGLEREVSRLRDRLTSTGILGMFGGKQRDVVSALLLENEQLHELLAQKQLQLRDLVGDMTDKLMQRLDEQTQESARAVRYKQVLLSAFLQHSEARAMLDRLLAEGSVAPQAKPGGTPELPDG
ncbi:MAG: hypothetical protein V1772_02595 [Chloroflexota bacterium]